MSAVRRAIVASLLVSLFVGCATLEIRETRVLTGRVTDESDQPVANTAVVIVGRSLVLSTSTLDYEEHGRQDIRAATDSQGQYRIEFVPANLGNNFYLFFHDKTGFDHVKYRKPEPLDITHLLGRDKTVIVNQVLQRHPGWAEVERQIAFYGLDSDRGKILRRHGLPEKRERATIGETTSDVWWYYADGVSYWFTGDSLRRTHKFTPIPGATPAK